MTDPKFDPMKELNKLSKSVGKVIEQGITSVQTTVQTATNANSIKVDIYEVNDNLVVRTTPFDGLVPESIEVNVENDVLTIKGETKAEETPLYASFYVQERRFGVFSRVIQLPIPVRSNEGDASAKLKNGVLTITIPVDKDRFRDITITPTD